MDLNDLGWVIYQYLKEIYKNVEIVNKEINPQVLTAVATPSLVQCVLSQFKKSNLQLRIFQAAVAAQSTIIHELKESLAITVVQEHEAVRKKKPPARPLNMIVKVKPKGKKAKIDHGVIGPSEILSTLSVDAEKSSDVVKIPNGGSSVSNDVAKTGLVSYSDESEDD